MEYDNQDDNSDEANEEDGKYKPLASFLGHIKAVENVRD